MTGQRISRRAWRHPAVLLAGGFGAGAAPYAPGTAGTLVGVVFYLALSPLSLYLYLLAVSLMFAAGVWLCQAASARIGGHDHPGIVWDEIVGYLIAMAALPLSWWNVGLGFALFRFFDIVKPWPIRVIDRRVGGGLGIMLDDVAAAVYAALVLHTIVWLGARGPL